jgi:hypothetical protein
MDCTNKHTIVCNCGENVTHSGPGAKSFPVFAKRKAKFVRRNTLPPGRLAGRYFKPIAVIWRHQITRSALSAAKSGCELTLDAALP